jgi:hypothetical protein
MRGTIEFRWGNNRWQGDKLEQLISNVLTWLVTNNKIQDHKVPWSPPGSFKRWFIVKGETISHKDGGRFRMPVNVGNYTIEAHWSRDDGVERLEGLFEHLRIE